MTFTPDSYWNTPVPVDAPRDGSSRRFVRWIREHNRNDFLALAVGEWAMPVARPILADPLVGVTPEQGPSAVFRLPLDFKPAPTNDAAAVVLDATTNQDVSLFEFDPAGPTARGLARYRLDSEGLDERIGGTAGNRGHRGIPGAVSCVRWEHLNAGEANRLKIAVKATAQSHVFPMTDHERSQDGSIPEGMLLRIKPTVDLDALPLSNDALTVALLLQSFGAIVGDNGGVASLKVERGITSLRSDALRSLRWSDFEFVERGWRP